MIRAVVLLWKSFCYTLGAIALLFFFVQGWFFVHVAYWNFFNPSSTHFMDERVDKDPRLRLQRRWLDYTRIATALKRAVIVAEDAKFADHEGFDWEGIQRALDKNQKKGRAVAGGSTISQQLAKNLFLSGERSYLRKAQEALITLMLEAVMDKQRILEIYLNVAEWGEGIFGAEAAAQHYFKSSAAHLAPEQAARLAAMLPRPRYYDNNRNTLYLSNYSARILARMPSAQLP